MRIKEKCYSVQITILDPEFTFKGKGIKPAQACRYLGKKLIQTYPLKIT